MEMHNPKGLSAKYSLSKYSLIFNKETLLLNQPKMGEKQKEEMEEKGTKALHPHFYFLLRVR